ncbi:MAG TPA: molecular chaperone DnaK [Porphyromonadaceae bacterium]|nr:molecular chaperone DnaK [Porphyromonadaceae bacterium]
MEDRVRYSDEELDEFKAIILEKLQTAKRDYELLRGSLSNRSGNDDSDTAHSFKSLEDGEYARTKEETASLAHRQMKFIQHLEAALVRIENKTYGICRKTGKLIPKDRLRAVPHATLSVEAKEGGNAR